MNIDTTRLRALLEGTAPGPWYVGSDGDWDWVHDAEDAPVCCMDGGMENSVYARTREFIAAMDPTTVRAPLDEVERLRAMLDDYPGLIARAYMLAPHLSAEERHLCQARHEAAHRLGMDPPPLKDALGEPEEGGTP